MMLTMSDCVDMSGLTEEEIDAIAEHEHVSGILALEMGYCLCQTTHGVKQIRSMMLDDIRASRECGNLGHAAQLQGVLQHFVEKHPEVD